MLPDQNWRCRVSYAVNAPKQSAPRCNKLSANPGSGPLQRYLLLRSQSVTTHLPSLITPYVPLFGNSQSHFGFAADLSTKK